jgi:hypothetical protein
VGNDAPAEPRVIELHDSSISALTWAGQIVVVHANVYVISGTWGWFQDATIEIRDASLGQSPRAYPLWIYDGLARVDGSTYATLLPIPFEYHGSIRLELSGDEGEFHVRGTHMTIVLTREPGEVEAIPADA